MKNLTKRLESMNCRLERPINAWLLKIIRPNPLWFTIGCVATGFILGRL